MAPATDRQRADPVVPPRQYPDQHMRVSDADRADVADRLARHYGDGRLDQAEFDDRISRAMTAKTVADFQGLFDDLPDLPDAPDDDASHDDAAYDKAAHDAAHDKASGTAGAQETPPPSGGYQTTRRRTGTCRQRQRHGSVLPGLLVLVVVAVTWHTLVAWSGPVVWLAILAGVIMLASQIARRH